MTGIFSQIVFMQPIILYTALALPLIWYLLRITPPAPKNIIFPPVRFLEALATDKLSPSKTPWWILLLRLLIVALIIIALARPVINPADPITGKGGVRLIIDNSWASAQSWEMQMNAAQEAISQAGRESREIYIITTTPATGQDIPEQYGPMSQGQAASILRGLAPNPWPADYDALISALKKNKEKKSIYSIWLSHGLDEGGIGKVLSVVQNQGGVSYISPAPDKMPVLLRPTDKNIYDKDIYNKITIDIDAPSNIAKSTPITVKALAKGGDIIDIQNVALSADNLPQTVVFDVLESLKGDISKFAISGRSGAGALFLLDERFKKHKIGIVSPAQKEQSAPLIEASYYIKRALEPYADITLGKLQSLIKENMSVIVLPDIAAMPAQSLNELEKWVKDGGLLLRFAGENMAKTNSEQFLLPVKLRAGGRSFSGTLSWDEQQNIAPFPENSPLYGLDIPDDITIKQYILADPAQDFEGKIWARLDDGTPFITAKTENKGLIVLIHTSANTSWSDFALSGLYVSVLKRIIRLAGNTNIIQGTSSYSSLDPLLFMDGYGLMIPPLASVKPLPSANLNKIKPSHMHPPGIYGHGKMQYALNIGTNLPKLKAVSKLTPSIQRSYYEAEYEINMMPFILYAALMLFILDWLVMIFIAGNIPLYLRNLRKSLPLVLTFVLVLASSSSLAFASEEADLKFSEGLFLAYIKTGDNSIDEITQLGLENLSNALARRTSVEPIGVVGLDPENDNMAFFPLIYWVISENQKEYSSKALQNIQNYLDYGGTILFDMRNNPDNGSLRSITSHLNIPPIIPIPEDHVLGRSFYLLSEYPGKYSTGILWVEQQSASGRDNVSSVIIGSNDWASAWMEQQASYGYKNRQQEMAIRFGINLVMYALTGNYKADQVHIPHILKRLGK